MKLTPAASLLAAALSMGAILAPFASAATPSSENVSRRDLRTARTALEEGRWSEATEIFERLLQSPQGHNPELINEALFSTALVLISSEPDGAGLATATKRLESLAARRDNGKELEIAALQAMIGTLHEKQAAYETLSGQLRAEQMAAEDARQQAALAMTSKDEVIKDQKSRNQLLRKNNKQKSRKLHEVSQTVANRDALLAQRDADIEFLTSQLEGTHKDQAQLLDAVIKKNEDLRVKERQLRATRSALQQKEATLEAQALELGEQEAALRKREAAIREVTERILAKEEPSP